MTLKTYFIAEGEPVKQKFFRLLMENRGAPHARRITIGLDMFRDKNESLHVLVSYVEWCDMPYFAEEVCTEVNKLINETGYKSQQVIFYVIPRLRHKDDKAQKIFLYPLNQTKTETNIDIKDLPFNLQKYKNLLL